MGVTWYSPFGKLTVNEGFLSVYEFLQHCAIQDFFVCGHYYPRVESAVANETELDFKAAVHGKILTASS